LTKNIDLDKDKALFLVAVAVAGEVRDLLLLFTERLNIKVQTEAARLTLWAAVGWGIQLQLPEIMLRQVLILGTVAVAAED
jgi:hypothetical protein